MTVEASLSQVKNPNSKVTYNKAHTFSAQIVFIILGML